MATLERGFKSWCERSALAIRAELAIDAHGPLRVRQLAEHLGVSLFTPGDLPGLPSEILVQLTHNDPQGWSAVSYTVGDMTTVIYNPKNSKGRQSSDIVHELAHVILDHEPSQVILSMDGEIAMRSFDARQEDEANWFGWTLLLPRPALLHCAQMKLTAPQIAEEYEVSEQLVTFRRRLTGVDRQSRARQRQ
jgi:Zn-dependent peptidase ImmA (M78 family)